METQWLAVVLDGSVCDILFLFGTFQSYTINGWTLASAVAHPIHSFAVTFNRQFRHISSTSETNSQSIGLSIALLMWTEGMQQGLAWRQQLVKT
jgi:hypothetical protein